MTKPADWFEAEDRFSGAQRIRGAECLTSVGTSFAQTFQGLAMRFKNILFPVDFSKQSADVARAVRSMAETFGARLTLFSVIDLPPVWYGESDRDLLYGDLSLADIRQVCLQGLNDFGLRHFRDFPVETVQAEGDPATMIRRHVESNSIDLVMMPTHGHGPFRLALLGSVTAKVLHDVKCAVWTSCHTEAPSARPSRCEMIVRAIDDTERSLPVIKAAASLAVQFSAKLILAHTISPGGRTNGEKASIEKDSEEAQVQARLDSLQGLAGVNVPTDIRRGSVEDVTSEAAREHNADLVVIGRGHHQEQRSLFRSRVFWIVRESPCPVLSVWA